MNKHSFFSQQLRSFDVLPSAWILVVQLCMLLVGPFAGDSLTNNAVMWSLGTLALFLVGRIIHKTPVYNIIGLAFVIPALLLSALIFFGHQSYEWVIAANLFEAGAYIIGAYGLTRYMFADRYLTRDELFAAASVFTLMVWAFAFLYSACLSATPKSFNLIDGHVPSWVELIFLSFSVQSATGLSDIYPQTDLARVLVSLQMFVGVMYLALIVSRLIAMQYVRQNKLRAMQHQSDEQP